MDNQFLNQKFTELSTPLIADSCLRVGVPLRVAPSGIKPVTAYSHVAGRVLPVTHFGSVDIFLEAMGTAQPGDILVIDNQDRRDEGCIGDLTVLEAQACKLAGIVVWGCHRDTAEIIEMGFPVFSYGTFPAGPERLDNVTPEALSLANFGPFSVSRNDFVFADADGALFTPADRTPEIVSMALDLAKIERKQANAIRLGTPLRDQLDFDEYLRLRAQDPSYSFREHLRKIGGAIEQ